MKQIIPLILLVLLLPVPTAAFAYNPVSYSSEGVTVTVNLNANEAWSAPFTETVNVSIGVTPEASSVLSVNITSVSVIINRKEADQTGYLLMDLDDKTGSPLASGVSFANYSNQFTLRGTESGTECYFAIMVSGSYSNGTHSEYFQALSPDKV